MPKPDHYRLAAETKLKYCPECHTPLARYRKAIRISKKLHKMRKGTK